ncbi:hypothetical protein pb186bvf_019209 [Paramecium bursaria]
MAQFDDLIQQKLKEIQHVDTDQEIANNTYKELSTFIQNAEDFEKLNQLRAELVDLNIQFEQDVYIQKKRLTSEQFTRDNCKFQISQSIELKKEFGKLQENKARIEAQCKDLNAQLKQINEAIKSCPETEKVNRQQMREKFEVDLKDIKLKIEQEDQSGQQFEKENIELKEKINVLMEDYKLKEQQFWDKVKETDEMNKQESQKYLKQFEEMQQGAQKAITDRLAVEQLQKALSDKKMRLNMLKNKQPDFITNLEQSSSTIQKLKDEIVKSAYMVKDSEDKVKLNKQRSETSLSTILNIVAKTNQLKEQAVLIEKEKEKTRAEIVAIQQKIKQQQAQAQVQKQEIQEKQE